MKQRAGRLEDDVKKWENEFQNQADVLIIVADADSATATKRKDEELMQVGAIFNIVKVQKGEILRRGDIGIEHFGYADGISQPLFFKSEVQEQNKKGSTNWSDEAMLNLALVKDPGGKFADSYGSFLVFRKLEQNVKAFKEAEKKLPLVQANKVDQPDLPGAMIVGRFEDGTEVVTNSKAKGITNEKDFSNDFDYSTDKNAGKCPFHSHIRITNPRADIGDTGVDSFVKSVRLVRRGIPYDETGRKPGLDDQPEEGVGLLFMCYQADLESQFEFIQSTWANKGNISGNDVGQDGIIGQGENNFQKKLAAQWGDHNTANNCDFSNPKEGFVKMKGGEYFFTPSKSFLKSLIK